MSRQTKDDKLGQPLLSPTEDIEAGAQKAVVVSAADESKARSLVISFILMVGIGLGNKIFQVPTNASDGVFFFHLLLVFVLAVLC